MSITYLLGFLGELNRLTHIKYLELLWQYLDLCIIVFLLSYNNEVKAGSRRCWVEESKEGEMRGICNSVNNNFKRESLQVRIDCTFH